MLSSSNNQESSYNRIGGIMEINKPQPKKQVRRRLHTSKPYQERLLNMAEARREIATALKFHRASMRQQHQTPANDHVPNSATATPTANHWPIPPLVPPPLAQENFDLVLPNQTLGLNLNFKDFNNLNTSVYYNPIRVSGGKEVGVVNSARPCRSLDVNEVGAKEDGKKDGNSYEDDGYYHQHHHPFEEVMEFPPWLINGSENSSSQHLLDHHFSDEYSPDPDPALPCMDIGEIEGIDGEWLA